MSVKATITLEVDDLAELAHLFAALGPQPANAPNVVWTHQTVVAPPPTSSPRSAPSPPPPPRTPDSPRPAAAKPDSLVTRLLAVIHDKGGTVADGQGKAGVMLADQLGLSRIHGRQLLMECDRNGLIERDVRGGSAGTTRVALTDAGYAAIGKSRSASVPAAQGPPDLSPPRVVEVIEEDDTPLVFKTREQRQQEIRDAQADVQYPRGEP